MLLQQDFSPKAIENAGRLLVPHLFIIFFLLLNVSALPLLPAGLDKPQFVLMAIYYWAIYRPTLLPPVYCFVLGLVMDILTGTIPGINALTFVMVYWLVRDQRRFLMGQPYSTIWLAFGFVSGAALLLQWALYGLAHMNWGEIEPLLGGFVTTLLLFPFMTLVLVVAHRMLPVASRPFP